MGAWQEKQTEVKWSYSVFNRNCETWATKIAMKKDEGESSQGDKCWACVMFTFGGSFPILFWHAAQTFALVYWGPPVAKVLNNLVFQGDVQKAFWSGLIV